MLRKEEAPQSRELAYAARLSGEIISIASTDPFLYNAEDAITIRVWKYDSGILFFWVEEETTCMFPAGWQFPVQGEDNLF